MLCFDTHLDEDDAVAFIENRMSRAERERAEIHVDTCSDCRRLLSALARAVASATARSTESAPASVDGVRLGRGSLAGRFVVIERVGAGAMGVVYSAYDPELDRKVALKLLHARDGGSRMLREAQAMARVIHPNVVTVYEVGLVNERLFVAMEFIGGPTLRGWLRAKPRRVREIIDVFTAVGRGVAAAHAAGIIHRDLKPDNVLIGSDERPRVTDFGLAHGTDERPMTIAGTPAYMAPEQQTGGAIDARSDQYAFCVALYEALYDRLPEPGRLRFTSATRRIPPGIRKLIARGLSPDSIDRHPSMNALLDALARAPARARLRWIAGGAALAVIALGGGISHRLRAERAAPCANVADSIETEWNSARKETIARMFRATGRPFANDAWLATERIVDARANEWIAERRSSCEATRIRHQQSPEKMALRDVCSDRRLGELRALIDVFATADATVVEHAVEASGKLVPASRCVDSAESQPLPPANPEQWRRVIEVRRRHDEARALLDAGKYEAALPLTKSVLADAKMVAYLPLRAEAYYLEGGARFFASDGKGAEDALFEAIADAEAAHYDLLAAKAWALLILAIGYRQARHDEARLLERPARAALVRAGNPPEWEGVLENDIGGILLERRPEEAAQHFGKAEVLFERGYGLDSIDLANALGNRGMAFFLEGRFDEAKDRFERSLTIERRLLGQEHPHTARSIDRLGLVLQMTALFGEAEREHERAVAILERILGPEHPELANPLINVGLARLSQAKSKEGLVALARAHAIRVKSMPTDHPQIALSMQALARAYELLGEPKKALEHGEKSHALLLRALPADHSALGESHATLASILRELRRYEPSLEHAKQAVVIAEKAHPEKHPTRFLAFSARGRTELALGRTKEAVVTLERALEERRPGVGDPVLEGEVQLALARALVANGKDRPRARALAAEARSRFSDAGPRAAAHLAQAEAWLKTH